jgi:hypothetical protein
MCKYTYYFNLAQTPWFAWIRASYYKYFMLHALTILIYPFDLTLYVMEYYFAFIENSFETFHLRWHYSSLKRLPWQSSLTGENVPVTIVQEFVDRCHFQYSNYVALLKVYCILCVLKSKNTILNVWNTYYLKICAIV